MFAKIIKNCNNLLLFDVNHSAAELAFDLEIVAGFGDAAAVGAFNRIYAQIVGAVVEGNYRISVDGVACEILLVYANAHGVLDVLGLHREVIGNFAYISKTFLLDRVDYAQVFLLRTVFYPRHRRAVKAEYHESDAYAKHCFVSCVHVFVGCADYDKYDAYGQTDCEKDCKCKLFVDCFFEIGSCVFHTFIVLQTGYLVNI